MIRPLLLAALTLGVIAPLPAVADTLPANITQQLPRGFGVLTFAEAANVSGRTYYVVALASSREALRKHHSDPAPSRPLLIYKRAPDGRFALVGRNDEVILTADDGGQCDPFEPGHIAVKGAYFTVENEVACGDHWTDYVTFRFDPAVNDYVFDSVRSESWSMNPSTDPNAEALISNGNKITRPKLHEKVPFARWKR